MHRPLVLTPQAKADWKVGRLAESCPPHHCISCCILARKSRALAFLPGCWHWAVARGRTPAWDVGLLAPQWPPALVYTEIYTSDAFSLFLFKKIKAAQRQPGLGRASQGIPSSDCRSLWQPHRTTLSTNIAEMHLNLIKFSPPLLLPTGSSKSSSLSSLREEWFNLPVPDWKGPSGL